MSRKCTFCFFVIIFLHNSLHLISQPHQRVVSLVPQITKNIYLMGEQDKLVGCTDFCLPAKADKKEVVASAITVNVEKVFSLQPDIVFVMGLTSAETIEKLRLLGINVKIYQSPKNYEDLCMQFREQGELIGAASKANEIINKQNLRKDSVTGLIPIDGPVPDVFFQIGAKPLFSVLPSTFMNDYILLAHANNIASDLSHGTITREAVLVKNPDIILVTTMGLVGEQEKKNWQKFGNLSAVKNNKIFVVDSDKSCSPTPVDFIDILDEIINDIYF